MTHYGLNPSFAGPTSVLPLFANALRRGIPMPDGRLRLFDGVPAPELGNAISANVQIAPGGNVFATLTGPDPRVPVGSYRAHNWHVPSLTALVALEPRVLRTLDWSMTNKRPDWSKPRVLPTDLLQATDLGMAVELQARAANILRCHLWWCAPARFELSVAEYEVRMEEMLVAIRDTVDRPPVLEYGNELWNAGFPVHGWLLGSALQPWQVSAAREIAALDRVARRVFGPPGPLGAKPYFLFVGGQLAVPSHLDRILGALGDLGVVPDLAGPALYVTPLKAQKEEWEATGAVPTQEELRASCFARLEEIAVDLGGYEGRGIGDGPLVAHRRIVSAAGVPFFACYEAGQALLAGGRPWRKTALEAQPTEWMGELYRGIRRVAEVAGVDLLNWYSAATDQTPSDPRVDVFGLLESTDLTKMLPKAKAARGD